MKKYLPLLLIPIILTLMILIIIDNKEKTINKIIMVETNYHYLYDENNTIDISFYTNSNEEVFAKKELYQSFNIKNEDNTKSLSLLLEEVYYSHSELYFGESWHQYVFKFNVSNLENNFIVDDAYLHFTLSNNSDYQVKIGSFKLIFTNNAIELNWHLLDSKKHSSDAHSISQIIIGLNTNLSHDLLIDVGLKTNQDYLLNNDTLTIYLTDITNYTNNLYILIVDQNTNQTYYLNNTYYLKEYDLLSKSSGLINIYEFN